MNIIKRVWIHIFELRSLIRSVIFCFKYLPIEQAKYIPIFLEVPIKVHKLKRGNIVFRGKISRRQITFVEGIDGFTSTMTSIYITENSKIIFNGKAYFSSGGAIRIDEGGTVEIGRNCYVNRNTTIKCSDKITLLDDVMIGWNNEINDNDGHPIYTNGKKIKNTAPIEIGPHVWITSHVKISKGVSIPENCIVAKGAVVTRKHEVPNTLIGGVPAKDIKHGINWSRH